MAARKTLEFPDNGYEADLTAQTLEGTENNVLTWTLYTELDSVFGYDVYYGRMPSVPGDNSNRISSGANGGQWIDVDGRLLGRCEPSEYFIVAYNRGRKAYSDPAQGSGANLCTTRDITAPVITVSQPTSMQEFAGIAVFSGTASDVGGSGIASVSIEVVGPGSTGGSMGVTPILSGETWTATANLEVGSYLSTIFAQDAEGNQSDSVQTQFSVTPAPVDATAPVITLTSPTLNQEFTSSQQLIEGTVNDLGGSGVASVQIDISGDQESVLTVGNNWSLTKSLPDGSYQLVITASDLAGNPADQISQAFSVNRSSGLFADGYGDTEVCRSGSDMSTRDRVAPTDDVTLIFENTFDSGEDIHTQLRGNWKSAYEWRDSATDVIINNESQFYVDVLGDDFSYRDSWTPFELLEDASENGYLSIKAGKVDALEGGPLVNGVAFADQDYVSGVLTTFGKHSLSPDNSPNGKVVIELRAKMPRGQGVFPAAWLYNDSFFRNNPEIDIFEYIGQSPDPDNDGEWKRPESPQCGAECIKAGRLTYDTFHTQYHGVYISQKGKLVGTGRTSVDDKEVSTGSIYTNPNSNAWWRDTWGGCEIDFSDKFHIYTLEWSAEEIVWYIDDIVVLRLDEQADSGGNLPGVNFVPNDTRSMYLTLNFALGSKNSYIGAPDDYTKASMDAGDLRYIIEYIKVWQ